MKLKAPFNCCWVVSNHFTSKFKEGYFLAAVVRGKWSASQQSYLEWQQKLKMEQLFFFCLFFAKPKFYSLAIFHPWGELQAEKAHHNEPLNLLVSQEINMVYPIGCQSLLPSRRDWTISHFNHESCCIKFTHLENSHENGCTACTHIAGYITKSFLQPKSDYKLN